MLATRIYGLNNGLGVRAVIRSDGCRNAGRRRGKDGRRVSDGVEISPFSD